MNARSLVLLAGLLLTATACGDQTAEPPAGSSGSPDDTLRGRTFLGGTVTENGKPRTLVTGTKLSLWFSDDGRLVANAGCNTVQGPVSTADGKLAVKDLSITDMGCDGPRHAQDDWLVKFLEGSPTWKLDADTLTVSSGTTTLTMVDRKSAHPDKPLEGTTWRLDSIVDGEAASHQVGMGKAYLTFSRGQVAGSTGCNSLSGPATVSGDKITFGSIATTRKACLDNLAPVEQAVVRVLRGGVTYDIESSTLVLRHPNGHALTLTAAG
jgi:heat shock protein HslJ